MVSRLELSKSFLASNSGCVGLSYLALLAVPEILAFFIWQLYCVATELCELILYFNQLNSNIEISLKVSSSLREVEIGVT